MKTIAVWILLIIVSLVTAFITLSISFKWMDYKAGYMKNQILTDYWMKNRAYQKEWRP